VSDNFSNKDDERGKFMKGIFANVYVGKRNILFGLALFLILGVAVGIPLTVDLFGGSLLTAAQYQTWKVLHGYGVFLAFVNFFFGYSIDRLSMTRRQKEIASWSFVIAGLSGGIGRSALALFSIQGGIGSYTASLIETVGFILGTFIFMIGQIKERPAQQSERPAPDQFGLAAR
jgi:hypothetical protein